MEKSIGNHDPQPDATKTGLKPYEKARPKQKRIMKERNNLA